MNTPSPTILTGYGVALEPLGMEHRDALNTAAGDGSLWRLHYTSVPAPDETDAYIDAALSGQAAGTMLPWVVRDLHYGLIVGSTRFHDIKVEVGRVEIGYTWYARSRQRSHVNTACKLLLFRYAFESLECSVVGLRTDIQNTTSQRAIEALGARRDGTLRRFERRRDGSIRDTVMFSVLDTEWPAVRQRLLERRDRHKGLRGV